jgi:hypothetical protein
MTYQNDVFISFTHIDDLAVNDGEKGWITRFHQALKSMLMMRLGADVKIWRDVKLAGNDILNDEVIGQLKKSAILVSVLSARYLKSEWCTREALEFCQNAMQSGGIGSGSRSRIFKVLTAPLDKDLKPLPSAMTEARGYDFFFLKDETPYELDGAYGPKYEQDYRLLLGKLAFDLKSTLEKMAGAEQQAPAGPTIYLAECSADRKNERELVSCELMRQGFTILPDRQLPDDEAEYVAAVTDMLSRSALSIHMIGSRYGTVPDGLSQKSIGILQNELAVAGAKSRGLKRLIWLPAGTTSPHQGQQAFITSLSEDAEAQFGADLIAGDLEHLKAAIRTTVQKIKDAQQAHAAGEEAHDAAAHDKKLLYLIHDVKDRESMATRPVRKLCEQLGFDVVTPPFDGDAAQITKFRQDALATCDALVLFYGAGDDLWKRAMDADLRKLAAYRRGKPLPTKLTYLAAPKTPDKAEMIDPGRQDLIDGLDGFSEAPLSNALQTALAPLRAAS